MIAAPRAVAVQTFPGRVLHARRDPGLTRMYAKTGIFYSTSTGNTADVAELIKEKLGDAVDGPFEVSEVRSLISMVSWCYLRVS